MTGYISIGTVHPLCALILLVSFQVSERPRLSAVAFCIVFAGILAVGYAVLCIAAKASAAV